MHAENVIFKKILKCYFLYEVKPMQSGINLNFSSIFWLVKPTLSSYDENYHCT